jgi:hypothetical protein
VVSLFSIEKEDRLLSVPKLLPASSGKLIFKAELPPKSFYHQVESSSRGKWFWADKESQALVIQSQVPDPWETEQDWAILLGVQHQKGDRSEWPYQLRLLLFPLENNPSAIPARIFREVFKGVFAQANFPTLSTVVFPVKSKIWLMYSFLPQQN